MDDKIKTLLKAFRKGEFDIRVDGYWDSEYFRCSKHCKGEVPIKVKYEIIGRPGKDIVYKNNVLKFAYSSVKFEVIDYPNVCKEANIKLTIPVNLNLWARTNLFQSIKDKFNQFRIVTDYVFDSRLHDDTINESFEPSSEEKAKILARTKKIYNVYRKGKFKHNFSDSEFGEREVYYELPEKPAHYGYQVILKEAMIDVRYKDIKFYIKTDNGENFNMPRPLILDYFYKKIKPVFQNYNINFIIG